LFRLDALGRQDHDCVRPDGFVMYGNLPYHLVMASRTDTARRSGKTARLDVRAEPERAERIAAAAAVAHQSVSAFMLDAAADRAEEVLDRSTTTALQDEHFNRVLDALDAPYVPNAALQRAARRR
jgi:uncharacterized protein (DUF1778 family)